jgi:hypothetical protein
MTFRSSLPCQKIVFEFSLKNDLIRLLSQKRATVLAEVCFLVFRDLPLGNTAFFAALEVPFITQPASGPASFGMSNHKCLIAVSGDLRERSFDSKVFDAVQKTVPGGPQFDLFDQDEKIGLFADVFVFNLFGHHSVSLSTGTRSSNIRISFWRGARESHPAS